MASTDQFFEIIGGNYDSHLNTTINQYLVENPTGKGSVLMNYLLSKGVSGSITIRTLLGPNYNVTLTNAIRITSTVENLEEIKTITNEYGQTYSAFSAAVDIKYADFYTKIINEQLEIGTYYRIVDYSSVNFINGKENADWYLQGEHCSNDINVYNPIETYVSDIEPIVVQAITKSEISKEAFSELYPQDVIEYNPYVNTIGTSLRYSHGIYNGNDLPVLDGYALQDCFDNFSAPITGFDLKWDGTNVYFDMPEGYPVQFGHFLHIYAEFDSASYYQRGLWEPVKPGIISPTSDFSAGYSVPMSKIKVSTDGKKVYLLDLTEQDYNNYDSDTLSVEATSVVMKATGWITRRTDTEKNVSLSWDWRNQVHRRYNVDLGDYDSDLFYNDVYYIAIGDEFYIDGNDYLPGYNINTNGDYNDYKTFAPGNELYNVTSEAIGGPDYWWNAGASENNIFLGDVTNTTFEGGTASNTFLGDCRSNVFNDNTHYNVFGGLYDNIFGADFDNNIISIYQEAYDNNFTKTNYYNNIIPGYFYENIIGSDFGNNYQFYAYNGYSEFYGNNLGDDFRDNTILYSNYFYNNKIGNNFRYNIFDGSNSDIYDNTIGNDFQSNHMLADFYRNTFGHNCTSNDLNFRVRYNTVGNQFRDNTGDDQLSFNKIGDHFRGNYWNSQIQNNTFENGWWDNVCGPDSWGGLACGFVDQINDANTHARVFLAENGGWKLDYVLDDGGFSHNIIDVTTTCP